MNLIVPCGCCEPARKRLSAAAMVARYRVSRVPKNAGPHVTAAHRERIQRDMIRMRRHLMIEGGRNLGRILRHFFDKKLDELCDWVERRARYASSPIPMAKADGDSTDSIGLALGAHEELWRQALEEVMGTSADVELMSDYQPAVQSVIAKSYDRTCLFLGEDQAADAAVAIHRASFEMARDVTRINETTRKNLVAALNTAMQDGLTTAETVRSIRDSIPEIARSRIPTIVRTEIGRAVDHGTMQSMKESSSVTHVQVIGCQAIEPGIPTIDGIPTCNIAGVPVRRISELAFHINHTGCIVPQYFVSDHYNGPIYSGGA